MRRREFMVCLGSTAAMPFVARAQQATKPNRVAYLALIDSVGPSDIKQRLQELGYIEGRNLIFDYRSVEGQSERVPRLATDVVRTNPDVLVTGPGTLTVKAAQAATATIPIVFSSIGDPIGAGIITSLNRPGASITGVTIQASEIGSKRLQILRDLVPGVRIVAVVMNPDTPFSALALQELRVAADTGGQVLEVFEVRVVGTLASSLEAAVRAGATGLITIEDPFLASLRREIVDLAAKLRLPTIYGSRQFVEAGGLISYGTDMRQIFRRAAEIVDKILKGTKPGDIPVEQPTKFELVINVKTAKTLDLEVPPLLLAVADEVIE
jgi:putative tryptophan/tyrosine transport system substrate-binding protein